MTLMTLHSILADCHPDPVSLIYSEKHSTLFRFTIYTSTNNVIMRLEAGETQITRVTAFDNTSSPSWPFVEQGA